MKLALIVALSFISLLNAKSISEHTGYPALCRVASTNDQVFENFKREPEFRAILEHISYAQGLQYLNVIEREASPYILENIEKCTLNDRLGNPETYSFGKFGNLSPSTLRYIKVSSDLLNLFGSFKDKSIIEIGGGYGGQCVVLSVLDGFEKYVIVDLPEVVFLQNKYLTSLGIPNIQCFACKDFTNDDTYDLAISNYAFSEIDRPNQLIYIENILNKSKNGYLTCNFISGIFGIDSLSSSEIVQLLSKPNRKVEIIAENPLTYDTNLVIVWKEV